MSATEQQGAAFELTGETKSGVLGYTVHQIRATRDLPKHGIRAGDLGGWVSSLRLDDGRARVGDDAWVGGNAQVVGNARVVGNAQVVGNARVGDDAWVGGNAQVGDDAWVGDDARVGDDAQVVGNARVVDDARVGGNAWVVGNAWVGGNAELSETWHYFVVGPIGSENVTATLARTKGGGHRLDVGCWTGGSLGTLMAEVKRRRAGWYADEATQELWMLQYRALRKLGKATVARWAEPEAVAAEGAES